MAAVPAAFRRLCVETEIILSFIIVVGLLQPPLGGCVLKPRSSFTLETLMDQPPLGGCVLKLQLRGGFGLHARPSRL